MKTENLPKTFLQAVRGWGVVDSIQSLYAHDVLPHFLLLTGSRGIGKRLIADELLQRMFCESGVAAAPCKQCNACRALDKGIHPNVRVLDSETDTGIISVAQARELRSWAYRSSDGMRIALIPNGKNLTAGAVNALLKVLEEPPKHFRIMVLAEHPQSIPKTLYSRAVHFSLGLPPEFVSKRFIPAMHSVHPLIQELYV